ncbi:MAG TPA: hypothetical protein QGF58_11230 [Myxococcota bacterium]|nr:hypothetical protein [Myxococcota bacterium]
MRRLARPHVRPQQLAIPVMSLCAALVPVLVAGAQFVDLAVIESSLPAMCCCPDAEPFHLTVYVHDWGWEIDGSDEALYGRATVEDLSALREVLVDVKSRHPHEGQIVIVPDSGISFGRVVRTLDTTRSFEGQELFPWPVFAGGIME